jgi:hypothetical protein
MSANWAIMKVAAVTKSGASDIAERSSASLSPLSCGLEPILPLSGFEAAALRSSFESLKSPLQIRILYPHPVKLVGPTRAELAKRSGSRRCEAHCFRVFEVRLDRRDHNARFDGHEIDSYKRDANPGVDDDALVEDAIENIN